MVSERKLIIRLRVKQVLKNPNISSLSKNFEYVIKFKAFGFLKDFLEIFSKKNCK